MKPEETPFSPEAAQRLLDQVFSVWIEPEIQVRRAAGLLTDGWQLMAAQIVFNIGGSNEVRLNAQVQAQLTVRSTRAIPKGEPIRSGDFSAIEGIQLLCQDENAGHVSIFRHEDKWYVFFDFRYNGRRVRDTLTGADEFLASAASNLEAGRLGPAMDDLHIATERIAKGYLLLLPDERFLNPKNHGLVLTSFGQFSKLGNISASYSELLKGLQNNSAAARYSTGPLKYGPKQLCEMLETARAMRRDLETRLPPEPGGAPQSGVTGGP
jgi:uncharacterized protein (UPF0332 family)